MQNNPKKTANSCQPLEVIYKKVLNIRTSTMETMVFVFYQN